MKKIDTIKLSAYAIAIGLATGLLGAFRKPGRCRSVRPCLAKIAKSDVTKRTPLGTKASPCLGINARALAATMEPDLRILGAASLQVSCTMAAGVDATIAEEIKFLRFTGGS